MTNKKDLQVNSALVKASNIKRPENLQEFFSFLNADINEHELTLTESQAMKLKRRLSSLRTGTHAAVPLICPGLQRCPIAKQCPFVVFTAAGDIDYKSSNPPVLQPCLTGDTLVLMADWSYKRIDEINVGDLVFSCDVSSHTLEPTSVTGTKYSGIKDVYKITTKTGEKIYATSNHMFWTIRETLHRRHDPKNGNISKTIDKLDHEWASIDSGLLVGDKLSVPIVLGEFGTNRLSAEFCKLIGYHLSNGTYSKYQLSFSNTNRDYIDEYLDCVTKLGSKESWIYSRNRKNKLPSWEVRVTSSRGVGGKQYDKVRELMKDLGLAHISGKNKRVPKCFFDAPAEEVALMINRFWAGNGCITNTKHGYVHSHFIAENYDLCIDFQILLRKFGIRSNINKRKGSKTLNWKLSISDRNSLLRFFTHIGNIYGKEEACIEAMLRLQNNNKCNFYSEEGDIFWTYIDSIEPLKAEKVYDIEIKKNSNFFANHILVHNCPLEKEFITMRIGDYALEHNLDVNSASTIALITKLAELDVYDMRMDIILSTGDVDGQGMDLMRSEVNNINQRDGTTYDTLKIHPAWEIKNTIHRQRMEILDALLSTPKSQAKQKSDDSAANAAASFITDISSLKSKIDNIRRKQDLAESIEVDYEES